MWCSSPLVSPSSSSATSSSPPPPFSPTQIHSPLFPSPSSPPAPLAVPLAACCHALPETLLTTFAKCFEEEPTAAPPPPLRLLSARPPLPPSSLAGAECRHLEAVGNIFRSPHTSSPHPPPAPRPRRPSAPFNLPPSSNTTPPLIPPPVHDGGVCACRMRSYQHRGLCVPACCACCRRRLPAAPHQQLMALC